MKKLMSAGLAAGCAITILLTGGAAFGGPTPTSTQAPTKGAPITVHAAAGSTTTYDSIGDSAADIDIANVHAVRIARIKVRANFHDFGSRLNALQVFYDTNAVRPGPEYTAIVYRGGDGDGLKGLRMYRAKSWRTLGARIPCAYRYYWKYYPSSGYGYFTVFVAQSCLEGTAGHRIRVHARAWNFTRYNGNGIPTYGYFDNAPNGSGWSAYF